MTYTHILIENTLYYGAQILAWFSSEDDARQGLIEYAAENGLDISKSRWDHVWHYKNYNDILRLVFEVEPITQEEIEKFFDRKLDKNNEPDVIVISNKEYNPSQVLKAIDPAEYQRRLEEFLQFRLEHRHLLEGPDGLMYKNKERFTL